MLIPNNFSSSGRITTNKGIGLIMSERNFLRFTRRSAATLMSLLAVVALSVTGCSTEVPAAPASTTNPTSEEQNREASWFRNKNHTCVQNKTSEPIQLKWSSYMQNDKGDYLNENELTKTLGPSAFACAVSFAYIGEEHSLFTISSKGASREVRISAYGRWLLRLDGSEYKPWDGGLSPVYELFGSSDQKLLLQINAKDNLRTIGSLEVYPVDVYITNAQ